MSCDGQASWARWGPGRCGNSAVARLSVLMEARGDSLAHAPVADGRVYTCHRSTGP